MTEAPVDRLEVSVWEVPTDEPESDGTLAWDSTTIVVVEARVEDAAGIGWTYTDASAASLIQKTLAPLIEGRNAHSPEAIWRTMLHRLRNIGTPGIAAMAVSAVDMAIWDVKARLLDVPLAGLLGQQRSTVPVYGSGGFTSYDAHRLRSQLAGWVEAGMAWVKMKVGRQPDADATRVAEAREAIGTRAGLFVDANGAYDRKQAVAMAQSFQDSGVSWYEEPVSSDDIDGLRFVRQHTAPEIEVTAGEYAFGVSDAMGLVDREAVDVLQADVTRCGGITPLMAIADFAYFRHIPFSTHAAPQAHLHPAVAMKEIRHMEWFHDHVRIESQLFDGIRQPHDGVVEPDLSAPGTGLALRFDALPEYRVV